MEYSRKGQYRIVWRCNPWDNTEENKKNIRDQFSKKYNIPKNRIKVEVDIIQVDEDGKSVSVKSTVIDNIQSPAFQQHLFEEYIKLNGIENIDFNKIVEIDDSINTDIDYDVYDKFGKIVIKKVEFDNFLSYGKGNVIDFTKLSGLILVKGEPANKTGKTTAMIEVVKFALYGSYTKAKTLDDLFNLYLPNETEVLVRCYLSIDGEDFVIERRLTRPKKRSEKSKTTSSVKYYKVIDGIWDINEPLEEYDENTVKNESDNVTKTNKKIKECLPKESDFDLVIFANSENLSSLINVGSTEKGRLFSRWTGLLPLENKENLAKDKWLKEFNPKLLSNQYNTEQLQQDITNLKVNIETSGENVKTYNSNLKASEKVIESYETEKTTVLATKNKIDDNLLKLDIQTVETRKNNLIIEGKNLRGSEETHTKSINLLKEFSVEDKDKTILSTNRTKVNNLIGEIATIKANIANLKEQNSNLEGSKKCPTCDREYDKETVSKIETNILQNKTKINSLIEEGKTKNETKVGLEEENAKLEERINKVDERTKLELKLAQVRVDIEKVTNQYRETLQLIKDYEKNKEDIDKNNNIDISVNNLNAKIKAEQIVKDNIVKSITQEEKNIEDWKKDIENKEDIIKKLFVEANFVRHYKLYLELVGKNGIKKIILRKVLPIINAEINNLISDLDDFNVEIIMNDKNDIIFNIIKYDEEGNSVKTNLVASSGYESTLAGIALRSVLSKFSTISIPNYCLFDEITARTGEVNYEVLYKLLDRVKESYQFVFVISHSQLFDQMFDKQITIIKENNISQIKM